MSTSPSIVPQRLSITDTTVASLDDGAWYLLRVDDNVKDAFLAAYPEFKGVDLPREQVEVLK